MPTRLLLLLFAFSVLAPRALAQSGAARKWATTDLAIRLFPDEHRMEVTAAVTLPPAAAERPTLGFRLRKDLEVPSAEITAPEACRGTAELTLVSTEPEPGGSRRWTLKPARPLPAGEPVTVRLTYAGGKSQGFVFYLGPEGCFAGGPNTVWYPRFDDASTVGALHLTVPKGWAAKGSGVLTGQRDSEAGTTFDFEVRQPSLFSFGAGKYVVRRIPGAIPVSLYLLEARPFEEEMVTRCRQIIGILEKEFGPYPYGEFAVVETPSPQSGASGFGGASFEGFMFTDTDFLRAGFNLALFGHEIGHQWWGNLVKQRGAKGRGIQDEGLAQYGSLRCVEELEGPRAAARYRRDGYPGYVENQCGRGYLRLAAARLDSPLSRLPAGQLGHDLPDMKGFLVYDLLARTIGRERFREALNRVTREHAFGFVTWDELLAQLQRSAGRDLGAFYEQWFDRPGAPALRLEWSQQGASVQGVIHQEEPFYRLTLPVVVTTAAGQRIERSVEVTGARAEFQVPAERPVTVELDPDFTVLHSDPALRADADAFRFWTRAVYLRQEKKVDEAKASVEEGLRSLPRPDPYGVEFRLRVLAAAALRAAGDLPDAQKAYDRALACPVRAARDLPGVFFRIAQMAKTQGDTARLEWAVHAAESADAALEHPTGFAAQARALLTAPPR